MSKIQFLKADHNVGIQAVGINELFAMSKIQFLKADHNVAVKCHGSGRLFAMSKIQFLKADHNDNLPEESTAIAVCDVKDTIFESRSQHNSLIIF